jgi:hypothetical protein
VSIHCGPWSVNLNPNTVNRQKPVCVKRPSQPPGTASGPRAPCHLTWLSSPAQRNLIYRPTGHNVRHGFMTMKHHSSRSKSKRCYPTVRPHSHYSRGATFAPQALINAFLDLPVPLTAAVGTSLVRDAFSREKRQARHVTTNRWISGRSGSIFSIKAPLNSRAPYKLLLF